MPDYEKYDLGDFNLQGGGVLPGAWIAYKTFGDRGSPAILYPSWYSGAIADNEWLVGEDKALNPKEYFIIITALFGNGQSISPSNSDISPFPDVTFYDNVKAQHQLLTQKLNIPHLRMVTGWSMGAGQTFQWATQYPDFVDIAVPFCGSAKTSIHNQVFLEGVKSALLAAHGVSSAGSTYGRAETAGSEKRTWTDEEKTVGLKAFGRGYAGWGFSQAFYRHKLHEKNYGAKDLEDFMVTFWEAWALSKDRRTFWSCYTLGKLETSVNKSRTTETLKRPWQVSRQRPWSCLVRRTCISREYSLGGLEGTSLTLSAAQKTLNMR